MKNKFTHSDIYRNARFAGQVTGFHTWPVLDGRSTGEHTWQVMRIWYQIFGSMRPEESGYLLWHDAGELYSGDPPGMVKKDEPVLKSIYDRIERKAVLDMGGNKDAFVDEVTKLRAKACDLIDLLEFGLVEVLQGNRLAEPIVAFATEGLSVLYVKLSKDDFNKVITYVHKQLEFYDR